MIAIIAILMVLLLSAINKSILATYDVQCKNNLRHIGIAIKN